MSARSRRTVRLRHDLNHATSALLLLVAAATVLTGIAADLWDLNEFTWHTYAGYAMAVTALAHVALNWGRLVGYVRFRLRRKRSVGLSPPGVAAAALAVDARGEGSAWARLTRSTAAARGAAVSRRALIGLTAGGVGGWFAAGALASRPELPSGTDLGLAYHEWSKPGVIDAFGTLRSWGEQPALFKSYPGAPSSVLPDPRLDGGQSTEDALLTRRSTRDFADRPLSQQEVSRLLLLTGGLRDPSRRTAPSSGALYPIEVYALVHRVDGLTPGAYHYDVRRHALSLVRDGDLRGRVTRQGLMQGFLGDAGVVLCLTGIFQRMRFKYQDRSYRYGLLEAGHVAQNAYLAATSMGLGVCAVGAFDDDDVNEMLGVDGREEAALYLLAVGAKD